MSDTQPKPVEKSKAEITENGNEPEFVVPETSSVRTFLPLKQKWTVWFLNNDKNLDWTSRLKEIYTFKRLEDFIAFYDNIRPPSTCIGCDYNLFKEGIQPMWEVPENKDGGRLVLSVDKSRPDVLDTLWAELLFALVGNVFGDDTPSICGAVCNIRAKGSKISLWTTSANDDEANRRIGQSMKTLFKKARFEHGDPEIPVIRYEDHKDVQDKKSSRIMEKFVIN